MILDVAFLFDVDLVDVNVIDLDVEDKMLDVDVKVAVLAE